MANALIAGVGKARTAIVGNASRNGEKPVTRTHHMHRTNRS